MSKTETAAPPVYVPGKYEVDALRYMHEWEPSSRRPTKHIVAQKFAEGVEAFNAFMWSPARKVWEPWNGIHPNATRRAMVEALMREVEWANLAIMDDPVDFADYDGFTPAEFDHCVFCLPHIMLCPVGVPGGGDGWARVGVKANGAGCHLGPNRVNSNAEHDGSFFPEGLLAGRFRKLALPVEQPPLGYERALPVPPILVRHDRVAREIVPKEGWGITDRPDLLARRMDRKLAINAAVAAEDERQNKAGEWRRSLEQIHFEITARMEKEWAAMAA